LHRTIGINSGIMEIILKTDNENSIAKIIALAEKLNVAVVQISPKKLDKNEKEALKNQILNFEATTPSSFGDATEWERNERR